MSAGLRQPAPRSMSPFVVPANAASSVAVSVRIAASRPVLPAGGFQYASRFQRVT